MQKRQSFSFPKHFLWGAGSSAHQIEGDTHNQWSVWELENAKTLANQSPYTYGHFDNWPDIKSVATKPTNYVSGKGIEHMARYGRDIDIIQKMNFNSWLFGVEWSRVEPGEDAWNKEALEYYKEYTGELKARGIEPILVLFHNTIPVWFAAKGGFANRANVNYYTRYVERIMKEIGVNVKYVITMYQPDEYARKSYLEGRYPPQIISKREHTKVLKNLALAHNKAAAIIHASSRRFKVSLVKECTYVYAGDDAMLSVATATYLQHLYDDYFLKRVVKTCDFLAITYSKSERVYGYRVHNPEIRASDTGIEMSPEHLQYVLERLDQKYHLPVLVAGSGIADADDKHRQWWIGASVIAVQRALTEGVQVMGYVYRSLFDGFEWERGFWPKYGLIEVDYATMQRKPRPSAVWYAKLLRKLRGDS